MPIYEYKCAKCGAEFEKLVLNVSTKVECGNCGSKRVERQLSVFAAKVESGSSCPAESSCPAAGSHCCSAGGGCCGIPQ